MSNDQKDPRASSRRMFFAKAAAGIGAVAAAGSLLPAVAPAPDASAGQAVPVSIHPLAVPRTNKSVKSHGE